MYLLSYRLIIWISLFSACLFLHGQNKKVSQGLMLDAEKPLQYIDDNQTIIAQGNAMLRGPGILLVAEKISWDRLNSIVSAETDVTLGVTDYRLLAKSLILDLKSGTFTAEEVRTGIYPWVINSKELVVTDLNYSFTSAEIKHENHEFLSPSFEIAEVNFDHNNSTLKAKGIGLVVGDKTIGKLASLTKNLDTIESKYELLGGKQQPLGWYAGVRFDSHKTQNSQSEVKAVSYFDRGIFLRPQFSYLREQHFTPGIQYMHWDVSFGAIKDEGVLPTDTRGQQMNKDRGYLQFFGITRLGENWRTSVELNMFSDSEVYRDYDLEGFESNQWLNNSFELAYNENDLSVSVASRWQANEYLAQVEALPELLVTYGPKPLWSKWIHDTLQLEYTERNKRNSFGSKTQSYSKLDLGYKAQSSYNLARGITYIPSLSFRWQSYDKDAGGNQTRSFWETGNEIRFSAHSDYGWENERWDSESLRHAMTFSLKHNHIRAAKKVSQGSIPSIEPYIECPNLGPIELIDYMDSDNLSPFEVLRAGWEHELLAIKNQSFRKWLSLQLHQDIWVDSKSAFRPDPYFYSQASAYPARWLSIDLQTKINTESGVLNRSSYGIRLVDGSINDLSLRYLTYDSGNSNLQSQFSHHLSGTKTISGAVRYDPDLGTIPYWSGSVSIRQPVGWEWRIYLAQRRGTLRENDFNWGLGVSLFSF